MEQALCSMSTGESMRDSGSIILKKEKGTKSSAMAQFIREITSKANLKGAAGTSGTTEKSTKDSG